MYVTKKRYTKDMKCKIKNRRNYNSRRPFKEGKELIKGENIQ
jgi:hypothetical protein